MTTQDKIVTETIDKIKLLVLWDDMSTFCFSRTSCIDCPYIKGQLCNKQATVNVLKECSRVFRIFLKSEKKKES